MIELMHLRGLKIQWNATDVATILTAWAHMEPKKAGDTVVGHEAKCYAAFQLADSRIVTDTLQYRKVVPD